MRIPFVANSARLAVTWLVLLLLVAACSSEPASTNDASNTPPAASSESTTAEESMALKEPITLRLATSASEDQALAQAWQRLADEVSERTDGQVRIETYFGGSLYGERTALEAIFSGGVDIGTSSLSQFAPFTDAFLATDLPFLWSTVEDRRRVYESEIGGQMKAAAEEDGLKVLAIVDTGGLRPLFTVGEQVRVPDDLEGLIIRTTASPIDQTLYECWGAVPTPMDFGEVYTALQQGVVDGEAPTYPFAANANHFEILDYVIELNYQGSGAAAAISTEAFNSLPAEAQEALLAAGQEAEAFAREAEITEVDEARNAAREAGLEIYEPSDAELELWRECAEPVYDAYSDQVPRQLIDDILAIAGD